MDVKFLQNTRLKQISFLLGVASSQEKEKRQDDKTDSNGRCLGGYVFPTHVRQGVGVLLTTDPSYSLLKTKAIFSGCSVHFLEHLLADHTLGSHLLQ